MDIEDYAKKHPNYWSIESLTPEIKHLIDRQPFYRMVDIGCGNGSLLNALNAAGYLQKFSEVWAVDLASHRLIDVQKIHEKIKTVQDDAQNLTKLPSNFFDLAISTQVIEHVPSDLAMLKSIHRICTNDAKVYLDTVYKKPYAWYFYKDPNGKPALDPTHLREYRSDEELLPKIEEAGFRIVNQTKSLYTFPVMDFFMRRMQVRNASLNHNPVFHLLRKVKLPIIGYYNWKFILEKAI